MKDMTLGWFFPFVSMQRGFFNSFPEWLQAMVLIWAGLAAGFAVILVDDIVRDWMDEREYRRMRKESEEEDARYER